MLATRTPSPLSGRSLGWYARRLSVMQPSELWARVGSQCGLAMLSLRHRLGLTLQTEGLFDFRLHQFCTAQESFLPLQFALDRLLDSALAARVLGGGLPEEGWGWRWRSDDDVWHRDSQTGRLWPTQFFGSIPYREGNPYGDVRRIWEPARLQQLVVLGLIAAHSDESTREQAVSVLEAQFLSWVEANPLHTGVHYISAMECGLRLITVCHAFDLIRNWIHDPERVWPAVLQLVDGHATLIQQRVSLHSSLGNHTIAEAAALVYAGILFPEMPRAEERQSLGLRLLETEAVHQIAADGGGAEQGFWYLRFISDLYGLVAGLLSSQGHSVPERIQRALKQSRSFLGALADSAGRIPTIGDSDNGYALSPLLSPSPEAQEKTPLITFFASGYSVLHSQGSPGTSLIFDHGPLGMGPCYAHGHADALSVLFRVDDEEFLVDPGTFAYSGHPEWRGYFRGTRAHNTVVIDDLDQAVQETSLQLSAP